MVSSWKAKYGLLIFPWSKVCFGNIFENVKTGFFLVVSIKFTLYKVKKQKSQVVMTKSTYWAFEYNQTINPRAHLRKCIVFESKSSLLNQWQVSLVFLQEKKNNFFFHLRKTEHFWLKVCLNRSHSIT